MFDPKTMSLTGRPVDPTKSVIVVDHRTMAGADRQAQRNLGDRYAQYWLHTVLAFELMFTERKASVEEEARVGSARDILARWTLADGYLGEGKEGQEA